MIARPWIGRLHKGRAPSSCACLPDGGGGFSLCVRTPVAARTATFCPAGSSPMAGMVEAGRGCAEHGSKQSAMADTGRLRSARSRDHRRVHGDARWASATARPDRNTKPGFCRWATGSARDESGGNLNACGDSRRDTCDGARCVVLSTSCSVALTDPRPIAVPSAARIDSRGIAPAHAVACTDAACHL